MQSRSQLIRTMDATCVNTGDGGVWVTVSGGTPPYTYAWANDGDTLSTQDLTGALAGEYVLEVTDANGCSVLDTFTIDALFFVEVEAMDDIEVCPLSEIVLTGTQDGATSTRWLYENGVVAGLGSTISLNTESDTNMYIFEGINDICVSRDTVLVYWFDGPGIDAGPDKFIEPGGITEIGGSPTASNSSVSVEWTPAQDLTSTTDFNPSANPLETTTYYVTAIDENECYGIDSMVVYVEKVVDPVGGFSPNGDGVNDAFIIDRIDRYPNAVVQIFNRWGNLIYESPTGYTTPWDGSYKGKVLPVGTYYYVIDLKDDNIKGLITGPVTILK